MVDCLIVGAGVVGLSLAYELAQRKMRVRVIDRREPGSEASWAGAGILPPASHGPAHPLDQLRSLSHRLHPEWAKRLLEETGLDTEYVRCGGIYLARTAGEFAALQAWAGELLDQGIEVERLSPEALHDLEPNLSRAVRSGYLLPDEAQLRNPRHLQALVAACRRFEVDIASGVEVIDCAVSGGRVQSLRTTTAEEHGERICFTAGAWTFGLLAKLGFQTGILPVRGQMVLYRCSQPPIQRILNEGSRYIVPRQDGHVLAGSTEEEVGFDKTTTPEAVAELRHFSEQLVPALRNATLERTWAGLRPGSFDGFPYMGRLPGLQNAFVAAGHFRSGLHLSTGTAVVMSQLMCDQRPEIDLSPFSIVRGSQF